MLAAKRLSSIRDLLNNGDSVSVAELSRTFNVTEETIRRDLDKITKDDHAVVRVHGGAYKIKNFDREAPYALRETLLVAEKERMAQTGYTMLEEGDTIMLDSSTSALHLAQAIKRGTLKISVITNSLRIALELSDCPHANLIVPGGAYRPSSRSFVGYSATGTLDDFHADKAFVSCSGLHARSGLTDNSESEARVRRTMLENSDYRYLLVDSDKFGRSKSHRIAHLTGIHSLFTDKEPDAELKEMLLKNNINIIVC